MRERILRPGDALYTEDLCDPVKIQGIIDFRDELARGGSIRTPVFVTRFHDIPGKYPLVNGNRRTKACELSDIPVTALEIETEHDFQLAQRSQPSSWHLVTKEEFLKYNGNIFYMDFKELKKQGLLCSAYHRARKRIKDTIKRFYPHLF